MGNQYKRQLQARARKASLSVKQDRMKDADLAESVRTASADFLESFAWKQLRRQVLQKYGHSCMCCGRSPSNPKLIHIDHIKPRNRFPELALHFDNLQVLCAQCNKAKGNKHATDYRPKNTL